MVNTRNVPARLQTIFFLSFDRPMIHHCVVTKGRKVPGRQVNFVDLGKLDRFAPSAVKDLLFRYLGCQFLREHIGRIKSDMRRPVRAALSPLAVLIPRLWSDPASAQFALARQASW